MNERKQQAVQAVAKMVDESPIVGILNMENLPAKNLAQMRKQLREKVTIYMTKKRLFKLAFKQCKKDISALEPHMKGMPALLLTKDNPFALFKTIKKNQSPAPIKAGEEAPKDLIVPAGPTDFTPGPIIGELGQMGIKSAVEDGKIAIKEDAVIAKEGDVVDEKQAGFLSKMGVEPMRIGLSLTAVWEDGDIYDAKTLDIDEDQFMADLQACAANARTLSLEVGYPTSDTMPQLLAKAGGDALALVRELGIITSDNVDEVLAKAHNEAAGLAGTLPKEAMEPAEKPVEEKKEEAPAEEKPAEEKAETPKEEAAAPTETPVEEAKDAPAEETKEAPTEEKKEEAAPTETPVEEKPEEKKEEVAPKEAAPEKKEEAPAEEKPAEPETAPKEDAAPTETPKEEKQEEAPAATPAEEPQEAPAQEPKAEETPAQKKESPSSDNTEDQTHGGN
ncbi:MAG: 50S ribosomal protein L10 [Candidatus Woesearchaeota archaeon]|nr:50S ribosomal protein L10 [Candidatus Woesearchaeota archaeon]